ncbi:hypothetical protein CJ191_01350 [Aerococcus viridans]|uniref:Uncharacterized protein n=1 Tax=Aerococcus viridans TaxID=1377 RepID=A0A2N6UFY9_9LACT|nr:hypothetical protein [Aerococcus viridans]PMC80482.1 hypothetical protein CJ191_01350 [Aerococcus viridans]
MIDINIPPIQTPNFTALAQEMLASQNALKEISIPKIPVESYASLYSDAMKGIVDAQQIPSRAIYEATKIQNSIPKLTSIYKPSPTTIASIRTTLNAIPFDSIKVATNAVNDMQNSYKQYLRNISNLHITPMTSTIIDSLDQSLEDFAESESVSISIEPFENVKRTEEDDVQESINDKLDELIVEIRLLNMHKYNENSPKYVSSEKQHASNSKEVIEHNIHKNDFLSNLKTKEYHIDKWGDETYSYVINLVLTAVFYFMSGLIKDIEFDIILILLIQTINSFTNKK